MQQQQKTSGQIAQRTTADPQEIARVAYELYEQRGRHNGHDWEDWFAAEAIIRRPQRARSEAWRMKKS